MRKALNIIIPILVCFLVGLSASYFQAEAIKRRLEIYEEKTSPLVEYYKEKGVLRTETVSISINRMGKDVANDVVRDIKK